MEISVIIPVYNAGRYLEKTLNNYLEQSCKELEFILVDDGSTDTSSDICDKFESEFSNVRVFHTKNHGVSAARNLGISKANGKYIAFLDSDDYIDKDMFKIMLSMATKDDLDVVHCGISMELEDNNGNYSKQSELFYSADDVVYNQEEICHHMLELWEKAVPYNVINKLYRRTFLISNHVEFSNLTMGEDLEFNLEVLKGIKNMGLTSKCFYHYVRERQSSATANYVDRWFQIRLDEHYKIRTFFHSLCISPEEAMEFYSRRFVNRMLGCLENEFRNGNPKKINSKINEVEKIINNEEVQNAIRSGKNYSVKVKIMLLPIKHKNKYISTVMAMCLVSVNKMFPKLFAYLKYKR